MRHGELISVVMPVYNRAHLLARVAGSVLAQSYRNIEFLIVDDASSDDIEGAVAALGDPRVRLVRRARNGGAAAARNTGVAEARGGWIAFQDSDDYCTFDRIELSVRRLESLPDDYIGIYGARLLYNEVDEKTYGRSTARIIPGPHVHPLSGDLAERTLRGNIINFPTLLVKKPALLAAGGLDEGLRANEDWDLCLRLTRQGPIGFVPEPILMTPTSLDPDVSARRVSRSQRHGAHSFMRITAKLRREGRTGPALAGHYVTTASYLLRLGRHRAARRYLAAAISLDPRHRKAWAHYLLSHAPGLHARLRKPGGL